jgi:hypothetical protein
MTTIEKKPILLKNISRKSKAYRSGSVASHFGSSIIDY